MWLRLSHKASFSFNVIPTAVTQNTFKVLLIWMRFCDTLNSRVLRYLSSIGTVCNTTRYNAVWLDFPRWNLWPKAGEACSSPHQIGSIRACRQQLIGLWIIQIYIKHLTVSRLPVTLHSLPSPVQRLALFSPCSYINSDLSIQSINIFLTWSHNSWRISHVSKHSQKPNTCEPAPMSWNNDLLNCWWNHAAPHPLRRI